MSRPTEKVGGLLSAAYRLFAAVAGGLGKKQLDRFWLELKIIRKKRKLNFKIVGIG
jgi:hypothetical protein